MRAGRLVELLLLLERRGRMSAPELARRLEVSERTIIRDLESLSGAGVPIIAIRGRNGGFELMEGYRSELSGPQDWGPDLRRPGRSQRAQVRISHDGRRMAAVLRRLQPIRVRRGADPDERGWVLASFRMWSLEATACDVLSLGPEIEVVAPPSLREKVSELAARTNAVYADADAASES